MSRTAWLVWQLTALCCSTWSSSSNMVSFSSFTWFSAWMPASSRAATRLHSSSSLFSACSWSCWHLASTCVHVNINELIVALLHTVKSVKISVSCDSNSWLHKTDVSEDHDDCCFEKWPCESDLCENNVLKQDNDVVMQDTLQLTPCGSNRSRCLWVKLWSGLTLTPMCQRRVVWLRVHPTVHRSHGPIMTTWLSWWWHISLWNNHHQHDPRATLPQPLSDVWCCRGKPKWTLRDIWKSFKWQWVHALQWCGTRYQFNGHVQTSVRAVSPQSHSRVMKIWRPSFHSYISSLRRFISVKSNTRAVIQDTTENCWCWVLQFNKIPTHYLGFLQMIDIFLLMWCEHSCLLWGKVKQGIILLLISTTDHMCQQHCVFRGSGCLCNTECNMILRYFY